MAQYFGEFLRYAGSILCVTLICYLFIGANARKPRYGRRLTLSTITSLLLAGALAAFSFIGSSPLLFFFTYTVIAVWSYVYIAFCYRMRPMNIVFCGFSALTVSHALRKTVDLIVFLAEIGSASRTFSRGGAYYLVYAAWLVVFCFVVRTVLSRYFENIGEFRFSVRLLSFYVIAGIITLMLGMICPFVKAASNVCYIMLLICELAYCALLIIVQRILISCVRAKAETLLIRDMWRRDREHCKRTQENIDLINIKCHDLRHRLLAGKESASRLAESVAEYGASVKTGNPVLDVILTDKSLRCLTKNIQFTCMADGRLLDFMAAEDVYSLFGNALENAMEYAATLDAAKRFISLSVRRPGDGGFALVHCENFFEGELTFENGLPVTTKADRAIHGYGMKSMRHIAEKYGGSMSVVVRDDLFQLDILFPCRKTDA